jgi:hypothetical protein
MRTHFVSARGQTDPELFCAQGLINLMRREVALTVRRRCHRSQT